MIELLAALVLLGIGWVVGRYVFPKHPKPEGQRESDPYEEDEPDYPCPWCKGALLEHPLIEEQEDEDDFATYADEDCPSCGNAVRYNDYTDEYDRVKRKVDKPTESA